MQTKNIFYTYIYLDTRKPGKYIYGDYIFDYEPFYVGKGKCGQWKTHLIEAINNKPIEKIGNPYKYRKIRKILKENIEPIILKVESKLNEQDAFDLEIWMIWAIGRYDLKLGPLTNLTDGGDGISGYIYSPSLKLKMSKRTKQYYIEHPETRKIISEYTKKQWQNDEYRKFMTESTRERQLGSICPEETKKKIADAQIGSKNHRYGKNNSDFQKQQVSFSNSKTFELIHPNGYSEIIFNLHLFCREHSELNLNASALADVANPKFTKNKTHRGFKCQRIES